MSRPLPPDVAVQVRPMPSDFSPDFEERNSHVRWAATLDAGGVSIPVELGFSRAQGKADDAKERAKLRASAWQATELARIGRRDLLDYCVVGRHKRA